MPVGLPITLENSSTEQLFSFKIFIAFKIISDLASPLSVTNKGFETSNSLHARAKSLILFSPTQIVVG